MSALLDRNQWRSSSSLSKTLPSLNAKPTGLQSSPGVKLEQFLSYNDRAPSFLDALHAADNYGAALVGETSSGSVTVDSQENESMPISESVAGHYHSLPVLNHPPFAMGALGIPGANLLNGRTVHLTDPSSDKLIIKTRSVSERCEEQLAHVKATKPLRRGVPESQSADKETTKGHPVLERTAEAQAPQVVDGGVEDGSVAIAQLLNGMQPVTSVAEQSELLSQLLEVASEQGGQSFQEKGIQDESSEPSAISFSREVASAGVGSSMALTAGSSTSLASQYRPNSSFTKYQEQRIVQRAIQGMESIQGTGGAVSIRLHPQELGSLHLSLRLEVGHVFAVFEVESSVAKEALLQNAGLLRDRLLRLGMEIKQFEVHVASDGGQHNASSGSHDRHPGQGRPGQGYQTLESRYAAQQSNRISSEVLGAAVANTLPVWFRNGNNLDVSI